MNGICQTCAFSKRIKSTDGMLGLQCRYEPPKVILIPVMTPQGPSMQISAAWPNTDEEGWCSKYEPDPMSSRKQ